MEFGEVSISAAVGGILAHSLRTPNGKLKKGRVLSAGDIANLRSAGYTVVTVARLEGHDASENEAAAAVARSVTGAGICAGKSFTGRANLNSTLDGLLVVDAPRIESINGLDESVTLCTLPPWSHVVPGQQIATVKIIPFGVSRELLVAVDNVVDGTAPVRVSGFKPRTVGLIQTTLPGTPNNLLEKMVQVTRERLLSFTCKLDHEWRCEHRSVAVASGLHTLLEKGCELICILGASAVVDRRDVVPAGIVQAGGNIQHFGIPVDPGNLILIANCGVVPVLALPGSVRSPRPSGFDEVLQRIIADVPPSALDIAGMGVGGLLK